MSKLFKCSFLTILIFSPVAFAAGTTAPTSPTRAQLVCELAELQAVGYDPQQRTDYPQNIQRALRLVEQKRMSEGHERPSACS